MATNFLTTQKERLEYLHSKANKCAKFHDNRPKTWEVVGDARFSPNMLT